MPDHFSHASVVVSIALHEDGPSGRKEVSSACWSRLDLMEDELSWYPKSGWHLVMVSTRVFMTVLNTSTERGHFDDTDLKMDWISQPGPCGYHTCEVLVQIGEHSGHGCRGMVV